MPEFSISGESIAELAEEAETLEQATQVVDSGLLPVLKDVIEVRNVLYNLTGEGGSVRKGQISTQANLKTTHGGYVLNLLKILEHWGIAKSSGQGGIWTYVEPDEELKGE